ncbi:BMP family ABC transporter substrate-binding protein [Halogeometricum sp. S1BR25-6]|uniref:BMP family ABC transporter substrate-binding protein n=1 Tax=Halogeometricum salsisoli TaxID=2950536 RepID=A0ABU2GDA2_9EURY|nr:BMP family ABC transporter substrate-binding protein [Halogeometricum sp. S1BR25-6]MDS0298724.1 BMP family ABC transporter substrate-binding protein [Halogeometricum sp. S1BR25-6]
MDRRRFLKATGVAGIAGLAGCSGGPTSEGDGTTAESTETSGDGESTGTGTGEESTGGSSQGTINVGMVYATGGLGDGSFNDQAQQGIQQASEEFDVQYDEAQPDSVSQFQNFQQQFASSTNPEYDLVSCIGYLQADALSQTASDYPDQRFMIVDSAVDADNVSSYVFEEHQGSFLAGVMAARLTTMEFSAGGGSTKPDEKVVGFVGGEEGDLIGKFEAGYTAGVKYVDDSIEVQSTYVGSFNEPTAGSEAAIAMYNSGADIIFHASGNTGTGVFQAAQENGNFAIGVDRAQSVTKPSYADIILGSMVKRVDTAVYTSVEAVANDSFDGGAVTTLGLEEDGVDLVYGDTLESEIPSAVKDAVSSAREEVVGGSVSVPTDPSNV